MANINQIKDRATNTVYDIEDSVARTALGALGTAAEKDVPESGDASSTEVVLGNDSRLTDARTPVSHTHTLSEITDAGTAAAKDSTNAVTANSTDLVESGAVKSYVDSTVSSAYHHAGTATVAELTSSLLVEANEGNVYNMTDAGTTTADFIEGAGKPIEIGDNVGICKVGNAYKFDLLSGFVDVSNFIEKSATAGLVKNDGTIDTTTYISDVSDKADKVTSATNGNFAGLDSNGNLTDSGSKASDFLTAADVSGKQNKTLDTAITVDGTQQTTVEGALGAINTLAAGNKTAIGNIKDGTTIDSFGDVESALADKADATDLPAIDGEMLLI